MMNAIQKTVQPKNGFVKKAILFSTIGLSVLVGCGSEKTEPINFKSGNTIAYKNGKAIAQGHGEGRDESVLYSQAVDMMKITDADSVKLTFKAGNSDMKLTLIKPDLTIKANSTNQ
jgi:hypothetical protein